MADTTPHPQDWVKDGHIAMSEMYKAAPAEDPITLPPLLHDPFIEALRATGRVTNSDAWDLVDAIEPLIAQYARQAVLLELHHAVEAEARIAELEAERAKRLQGDTTITELMVRDGSLSMQAAGGAAALLAEMLAEQYKDAGGTEETNYIEFQFSSQVSMPGVRFLVTVQRVEGKTPHELRQAAEADAARFEYILNCEIAAASEYISIDETAFKAKRRASIDHSRNKRPTT